MRVRAPVAVLVAHALTLAGACACGDDEVDARYATPEATIHSLLAAYGVEQMDQDEIQRHMRARGRFELRDEAGYRGCFADYDGPHHEGLAGYVFGTVAAAKDQLRIVPSGDKVFVYPNRERSDRYVVLVERDGGWKILLHDSVPADVRRALVEEYGRLTDRRLREGATQ